MLKQDLESLKIKDLKHVMTPLVRGGLLTRYIDVGFDSEYTSEVKSSERELISLQFSLGKGRSSLYFVNKKGGITGEELAEYTMRFLNEQDVEPQPHIYLIAHFAQAEISMIKDFYDEYVKNGYRARPKVAQFNKAMRWERTFDDVTIHISDLYGHMKTSLEKIGAGLGYEKIKIEAEGKGHDYWIVNMKELSERHRDVYEAYAVRDAEICIEAWNSLKEAYNPLNLDVHKYTTYTSLAIAGFRRRMTKMPCKTVKEKIMIKSRSKKGEWKEHPAKRVVYADDYNVRILAALAYWGGHTESFGRGYLVNVDGYWYDFKSLYIIAGILQPLSNEFTDYKKITIQDVKDGYEGFCQVEFRFPEDQMYPCMPVKEDYFPKLMFPLSGVSYCTLSELRQALEMGVQIDSFTGFGFYPEENEVEHELKVYLTEMLKKKSDLETAGKRTATEYAIEKGKMVGVMGRFGYRRPSSTAEDISRLLHESGLKSEEFRKYGRKKAIRELYTRAEVGSSWHIEWASLVVGKARSMAAMIIPQGEKCLAFSTDGGFWLGNPRLEDTELHKQILPYHSGIRLEGRFDEIWVGRTLQYIAWNKGEMIHSGRGGGITVPGKTDDEKKLNFENMVRESLKAGKELYHEAEMKRLTGLTEYIHDNVPLNSDEVNPRKFQWRYDGKRRLQREAGAFEEWTDAKPYETVEEAYREWYEVKPVGRPPVLTETQKREIRATPWSVSSRDIAKKYGVSESLIKKTRRF